MKTVTNEPIIINKAFYEITVELVDGSNDCNGGRKKVYMQIIEPHISTLRNIIKAANHIIEEE
jgi:hypothetical protein